MSGERARGYAQARATSAHARGDKDSERQWLDLLHLMDQDDAEAGQREVLQTITIPRPHVPYGPTHLTAEEADADYLGEASRRIAKSQMFGSNLTATVARLCQDAADALTARARADRSPEQP